MSVVANEMFQIIFITFILLVSLITHITGSVGRCFLLDVPATNEYIRFNRITVLNIELGNSQPECHKYTRKDIRTEIRF